MKKYTKKQGLLKLRLKLFTTILKKDIKSEIREEFLGRNYYLEIKDLFDAIEAESNSRIDSNCRNDSHHIFASQVARTRSCERRGGGEVMSQRR